MEYHTPALFVRMVVKSVPWLINKVLLNKQFVRSVSLNTPLKMDYVWLIQSPAQTVTSQCNYLEQLSIIAGIGNHRPIVIKLIKLIKSAFLALLDIN